MRMPFVPSIPLPRFAYSYQTFSVAQVLTAAQVQQIEDNVRDHVHGDDSVVDQPGANLVLLDTQTANDTAGSLVFDSGIDATYDEYELHVVELVVATDGTNIQLQVSEDGGSNWKTTSGDYGLCSESLNSAGTTIATTGNATGVFLADTTNGINNSTSAGVSGVLRFSGPAASGRWKAFLGKILYYQNTTDAYARNEVGGFYDATTNAINAVRLITGSGNLVSGSALLYGVKKT